MPASQGYLGVNVSNHKAFAMDQSLQSKPFARVEDDALLRGRGRLVDDAPVDGQAVGLFVRSPHAHARIKTIDVAAARGATGVIAVLTGPDVVNFGVTSVSRHPPIAGGRGSSLVVPPRPALAVDRVMHVGTPVALVVAKTQAAAQDAAELVEVTYEALPAVTSLEQAIEHNAPQLWPEAPGNIALDWVGPVVDEDGTKAKELEQIFASAEKIARVRVINQPINGAPMEPRGATARYDRNADRYHLRCCSQGATTLRDQLVGVMGLKREQLDVLTEDVGGAFGLKTSVYPEYPALLAAARISGHTVHWMSTRSEALMTDNHARDTITEGELALDDKGRFLALRVKHIANMGGYLAAGGANIQTMNFSRCFPTVYAIPHIAVNVRCVFSNVVPSGAFRGAGRPEANYLMERLVEEAARVTGIDPVRLRRRNFVTAKAMPYPTAVGTTIDSGDFAPMLDQALRLSEYESFPTRRRDANKRGKRRGIGVSMFLEHAGGMPSEGVELGFPGDGTLQFVTAVQATGQSHATVFGRLVADQLGISPDKVRHLQGRTRPDIAGAMSASVASRSTIVVGSAIVRTAEALIEKGKRVASLKLEAAEADIVYRDGAFAVAGTDRKLTLFDAAAAAAEMASRGEIAETLTTAKITETPQAFPNGCHIAEVEIDSLTGATEVIRYAAVDDCGRVLDPVVVAGQVQGGIAHALGQALMEELAYDSSGQLIAGSFMDYAIPHATDMPEIREANRPVLATTNPLGVKGVGEAGTTGGIAAIMIAVCNALGETAKDLQMPATAEKVWRALQKQ
jgi:carbon-monoxide dehydrogenase large subunit